MTALNFCILTAALLWEGWAFSVELPLLGELPGTTVSVLDPTEENGGAALGYDDWTALAEPPNEEEWMTTTVVNGVGYELGPAARHIHLDYSPLIEFDLSDEMYGRSTAAYIRYSFSLDDALEPGRALLSDRLQCDDGFALFVNGDLFDLSSFIQSPRFLRGANGRARRETSDPEVIAVPTSVRTDLIGPLKRGENIIASQRLNHDLNCSDFLVKRSLPVVFLSDLPEVPISGLILSPPEPPVIRVHFRATIGRRYVLLLSSYMRSWRPGVNSGGLRFTSVAEGIADSTGFSFCNGFNTTASPNGSYRVIEMEDG